MNRLAVLLLAAASSSTAWAFAPQRPTVVVDGSVVSRSRVRLFSSEAPVSVPAGADQSDDDSELLLLPEYAAALDKTVDIVKKTLADKPEMVPPLEHFCREYIAASQKSHAKTQNEESKAEASMQRILEGLQFGFKYGMGPDRYIFGPTHDALRGDPDKEDGNVIDFYQWGCDFFRPMIDMDLSYVGGRDNLQKAVEQAANGDNVVFLANHQSEADPQVVSTMMEMAGFKEQAEKVVFVAGHKVTTDSLAIPFSMGRNLICIHSKKHIDAEPEKKAIKNRQNLAAMNGMLGKLKEGGCMLWVAPSGGRDRRNVETAKTPIAPFDSKTVDMFRIMGLKSKVPTHFYTMATVSYEVCPPPDSVEAGTGEQRNFRFVPVGISIGREIVEADKKKFPQAAYQQTLEDYAELRERLFPGTAPEM